MSRGHSTSAEPSDRGRGRRDRARDRRAADVRSADAAGDGALLVTSRIRGTSTIAAVSGAVVPCLGLAASFYFDSRAGLASAALLARIRSCRRVRAPVARTARPAPDRVEPHALSTAPPEASPAGVMGVPGTAWRIPKQPPGRVNAPPGRKARPCAAACRGTRRYAVAFGSLTKTPENRKARQLRKYRQLDPSLAVAGSSGRFGHGIDRLFEGLRISPKLRLQPFLGSSDRRIHSLLDVRRCDHQQPGATLVE